MDSFNPHKPPRPSKDDPMASGHEAVPRAPSGYASDFAAMAVDDISQRRSPSGFPSRPEHVPSTSPIFSLAAPPSLNESHVAPLREGHTMERRAYGGVDQMSSHPFGRLPPVPPDPPLGPAPQLGYYTASSGRSVHAPPQPLPALYAYSSQNPIQHSLAAAYTAPCGPPKQQLPAAAYTFPYGPPSQHLPQHGLPHQFSCHGQHHPVYSAAYTAPYGPPSQHIPQHGLPHQYSQQQPVYYATSRPDTKSPQPSSRPAGDRTGQSTMSVPTSPPIENFTVGTTRDHPQPPSHARDLSPAIEDGQSVEQEASPGSAGLSPGQVPDQTPDKKILEKQESYRRKAELVRQRRHATQSKPRNSRAKVRNEPAPAIQGRNRSTKRMKSSETSILVQPTIAPSLYHAHFLAPNADYDRERLGAALALNQAPQYYTPTQNNVPHLPYQEHVPDQYYSSSHFGTPFWYPETDQSLRPHQPVPKPPSSWDDHDQDIVRDYENYKWSVKLYKIDIDKTGHQFAESWLESQFGPGFRDGLRWFTHVTRGFIKDGNHLTFLVLHNAANPFQWNDPPKSTTSIGCYGLYWYHHSEIHWKTLAPGLRSKIEEFVTRGLIQEVQKWHIDMKATEKRFHRAYWLAANMRPLGGLLHRASTHDLDNEQEEVKDEDFEVTEMDLSNKGFDIPLEEAKSRWEECRELAMKESHVEEPESMATGSSEW